MSISKEQKQKLIEKFRKGPADTGSTGLQVACLTERIQNLSSHLGTHAKDFHCQRGLLTLVGKRKRLLSYLAHTNAAEYSALIKELGIRSTVKENV